MNISSVNIKFITLEKYEKYKKAMKAEISGQRPRRDIRRIALIISLFPVSCR